MAEIMTPQGLVVGLIVPEEQEKQEEEAPKKRGPKKAEK